MHNRTQLFDSIFLKHGRHFDNWNQPLNMRMRVCYLYCHETGLCCYLLIHIENLLQPFCFHLWPIYWLPRSFFYGCVYVIENATITWVKQRNKDVYFIIKISKSIFNKLRCNGWQNVMIFGGFIAEQLKEVCWILFCYWKMWRFKSEWNYSWVILRLCCCFFNLQHLNSKMSLNCVILTWGTTLWEPSNARQRLVKHVSTVTKLFTLQRQQFRRVANILVTQDINNEARRFLCNRNKVI
jgi:hypothetical protein